MTFHQADQEREQGDQGQQELETHQETSILERLKTISVEENVENIQERKRARVLEGKMGQGRKKGGGEDWELQRDPPPITLLITFWCKFEHASMEEWFRGLWSPFRLDSQ